MADIKLSEIFRVKDVGFVTGGGAPELKPLPAGTETTGNIFGFHYYKTGDHTITVEPGICMDATNSEVLELLTDQTVTLGSTVNEIYYLFLCDDGVVRADTETDGSTLTQTVWRFIGCVLNDASGILIPFTYKDGFFQLDTMKGLGGLPSRRGWYPFSLAGISPWERSEYTMLTYSVIGFSWRETGSSTNLDPTLPKIKGYLYDAYMNDWGGQMWLHSIMFKI